MIHYLDSCIAGRTSNCWSESRGGHEMIRGMEHPSFEERLRVWFVQAGEDKALG